MKDNLTIYVVQRNEDGALYTSGSINSRHEVVEGRVEDLETGKVVQTLTAREVENWFTYQRHDISDLNEIYKVVAVLVNRINQVEKAIDRNGDDDKANSKFYYERHAYKEALQLLLDSEYLRVSYSDLDPLDIDLWVR